MAASACAGPWLRARHAHGSCGHCPGHERCQNVGGKSESSQSFLKTIQKLGTKNAPQPHVGQVVSMRTKPHAQTWSGAKLWASLSVLCGDSARGRERRPGDQPGKPPVSLEAWTPQPPGATRSQPDRPTPALVTNTGGGEGPRHVGPAANPAEHGLRQKRARWVFLPCHARGSRLQRTRVPGRCSLFSGGSEPQGGEGLQEEESHLAQRMQYFPEVSPGSAGGARAEHI